MPSVVRSAGGVSPAVISAPKLPPATDSGVHTGRSPSTGTGGGAGRRMSARTRSVMSLRSQRSAIAASHHVRNAAHVGGMSRSRSP
jgi:hypothetical protein